MNMHKLGISVYPDKSPKEEVYAYLEKAAKLGYTRIFTCFLSIPEDQRESYLVEFKDIPKADCIIVAVGHNEYRSMSMMKIKEMFKEENADDEKVLIDVKSLYRMDELKASGMRFWRL